MIDRAEDPEKMIKQVMMDMENQYLQVKTQVAVSIADQHMLEKNSPVDVMLDPGNYVIDITLSGYAPVHKVITADKDGKVVVDEALQRE